VISLASWNSRLGPPPPALERKVHARRDRDEQRHDGDLVFPRMLGEHDRDARLAVDAATPQRHLAIELGGHDLEGADMAGRDVGCVHGDFRWAASAPPIDRAWPHQVALPADQGTGENYKVIHEFAAGSPFARAGTRCVATT
jgi:hypothetical protein